MANLSSDVLLNIFESNLGSSTDFQPLSSGKNPCHFRYGKREFYAYIKNISPAYFKPGEDDVWRVQLTGVRALDEIKSSDATFILIGYDDLNDVFATWNPYIVKQRIGTAASPSFYSRLSVQDEIGKGNDSYRKLDLNNDQKVLIFKANFLPKYLADIDVFFDDEDYVAMGSKRRTEANKVFKTFCDRAALASFLRTQYGINLGVKTIRDYVKKGILAKFKKHFLKYDNINDYKLAIKEIGELYKFDDEIEYSFISSYVDYLAEKVAQEKQKENTREMEIADWLEGNIDDDGRLFRITNPELVQQLREFMFDQEYPRPIPAINITMNFYGDRFPNMSFADWSNAVNNIIWDIEEAKRISIGGLPNARMRERTKRRLFILEGRGPFSCRKFVLEAVKLFINSFKDTTLEELKEIFPERSSNIVLFITDEQFSKLRKDQKRRYSYKDEDVLTDCNGVCFRVSNQWNISDVFETIIPILDDYGIAWKEINNDELSV